METVYLLAGLAVCIAVATIAAIIRRRQPATEQKIIGIAMPENYLPRWVKNAADIEISAQKLGYKTIASIATGAQELQNEQIEKMLSQHINFLIVCNVDDTIKPALAQVKKQNIPILAYDRLPLGSPDVDFYVTFDNYRVGVLQGEALEKGLDLPSADPSAPKSIVLFAGSPTDNNAKFFYDGAMSVLGKYIDSGKLKVIGDAPKNSADPLFENIGILRYAPLSTRVRMTGILRAEARDITLDAVLSPNDVMARAIIEACLDEEKYQRQLPLVTGQDADFASMLMIKDGRQLMTVFKNSTRLAQIAVQIVDSHLQKYQPKISDTIVATDLNTSIASGAVRAVTTYLVEPVAVYRGNFSAPISANFYPFNEIRQLQS